MGGFGALGVEGRVRVYRDVEFRDSGCTWTPKVCRIIAFYGLWANILRTFEGLGSLDGYRVDRGVGLRVFHFQGYLRSR